MPGGTSKKGSRKLGNDTHSKKKRCVCVLRNKEITKQPTTSPRNKVQRHDSTLATAVLQSTVRVQQPYEGEDMVVV